MNETAFLVQTHDDRNTCKNTANLTQCHKGFVGWFDSHVPAKYEKNTWEI